MLEKISPFLLKTKSKSGCESEVTVCECEGCSGCSYKEKCARAKGIKQLHAKMRSNPCIIRVKIKIL